MCLDWLIFTFHIKIEWFSSYNLCILAFKSIAVKINAISNNILKVKPLRSLALLTGFRIC